MNMTELEEILKKMDVQMATILEAFNSIKEAIEKIKKDNVKIAVEPETNDFMKNSTFTTPEPTYDFMDGVDLSTPDLSPDTNNVQAEIPVVETKVEPKNVNNDYKVTYTSDKIEAAIRTLVNPNASAEGLEAAVNILTSVYLSESKYNEVLEKSILATHLTADIKSRIRNGIKKEPLRAKEADSEFDLPIAPRKIVGTKILDDNLLVKIGKSIKTIPQRLSSWIEKKREEIKQRREAEANIVIPNDEDILSVDYQLIMMFEKSKYRKNGQDDEESLVQGISKSEQKKEVIVAQTDNMGDKTEAYLKCAKFLKKHPDYIFVEFNKNNVTDIVTSYTGVNNNTNEKMYGLVSKSIIESFRDLFGNQLESSNEKEYEGRAK